MALENGRVVCLEELFVIQLSETPMSGFLSFGKIIKISKD